MSVRFFIFLRKIKNGDRKQIQLIAFVRVSFYWVTLWLGTFNDGSSNIHKNNLSSNLSCNISNSTFSNISSTSSELTDVTRSILLPILYVINTHYHGDHTFGNQTFRDSHNIIAHKNVRKALEFETGKEHLEVFKSLKIPGIEETVVTPPNIIFKDKMDIYVG